MYVISVCVAECPCVSVCVSVCACVCQCVSYLSASDMCVCVTARESYVLSLNITVFTWLFIWWEMRRNGGNGARAGVDSAAAGGGNDAQDEVRPPAPAGDAVPYGILKDAIGFYNGKGDALDFVERMERYVRANRGSDRDLLRVLPMLLTEAAAALYVDARAALPADVEWSVLKESFVRAAVGCGVSEHAQRRLRQLVQRDSVSRYANEFQALVSRLDERPPDGQLVRWFVGGLLTDHARYVLERLDERKLDRAVTLALRAEAIASELSSAAATRDAAAAGGAIMVAADAGSGYAAARASAGGADRRFQGRSTRSPSPPLQVRRRRRSPSPPGAPASAQRGQAAGPRDARVRRANVICYRCRRRGHIAADCRGEAADHDDRSRPDKQRPATGSSGDRQAKLAGGSVSDGDRLSRLEAMVERLIAMQQGAAATAAQGKNE